MSSISSLAQFFIAKPVILPGEIISGYIARVSPFATRGGIDTTLMYQNKPKFRLPWLFPSGLQQLAELYGQSVPSAEVLLDSHTVFPLFRPFLPDDAVASLRGHFLEKPARGAVRGCAFSSVGSSNRWALAVCAQCVAEDSKQGGARWRTVHFVPGLALCPFHFEPLFSYCNQCKSGFRHSREAWQPRLKCACGNKLHQIRTLATEIEWKVEASISNMVRQLLVEEALCNVGHSEILSAISRRAKLFGHGGAGGIIRIRSLIEKKIGLSTLSAYQFSTGANTAFRQSLAGVRLSRNPIHNLFLIYALFGGIDDLLNSLSSKTDAFPCRYVSQESPRVVRRRQRPRRYQHWQQKTEEELHELRRNFRSILLRLKSEIPNLKRYQLKSLGAREAYAFFCRFDKEWLGEILPCRPFIKTSSANRDRWNARRDHLLATHIRIRYELLIRSPSPIRVTHRRLLEGHSLQPKSKKYFERFPNTKMALEECIESMEEWRLRELRALINQVFEVSSNAPFQRDLDLSHLSFRKIKTLKEKIRKWLKKKILES
jgi:hypothetical protein